MGIRSWIRRLFGGAELPLEGSFLVVGLGNPGVEYRDTRHNIGFRVAEHFSARLERARSATVCRSEVTVGAWHRGDGTVAVAKPLTFMNRSGEAVGCLLRRAKADIASCLVIVDDIHLPVGSIRIRRGGSDGGHNGLKSIIGVAGREFPRVRVGVGPVPRGHSMIDFVLGPFSQAEQQRLETVVPRAADAIGCVLTQGIEPAMNEYN
ncbi:MAG: aminoacyl-tRNA hydrolase [Chitinivibrionales bacterium]|nr:aminoacyl-tRNA hydrolase [Chitinivibrionales bacterium]